MHCSDYPVGISFPFHPSVAALSLFDFRACVWDVGCYQLRMSNIYWRAVQLIFLYEVELPRNSICVLNCHYQNSTVDFAAKFTDHVCRLHSQA